MARTAANFHMHDVASGALLSLPSAPTPPHPTTSTLIPPGVEKVARAAADPELRDVASGALLVLERIVKEASAMQKETKAAAANQEVRGLCRRQIVHRLFSWRTVG